VVSAQVQASGSSVDCGGQERWEGKQGEGARIPTIQRQSEASKLCVGRQRGAGRAQQAPPPSPEAGPLWLHHICTRQGARVRVWV